MPSMEISSTSRSASTRSSPPASSSMVSASTSAGAGAGWSGATAVMRQILAHGATTVHSVGVAGRPPVSSRAAIERVAFTLFARQGFDETTVEDIAAAAGISRRTFFRYFASKNDVVWGEFDRGLE